MWKHRRAVIERGASGRFGRCCLIYLVLFHVLLPLFAPMVDVAMVYSLLFLNPGQVPLSSGSEFACLQALICAYALRLDGERLTPLWALPLQQLRLPATAVPGHRAIADHRAARQPPALAADPPGGRLRRRRPGQ